jgi:hypothetical protein
MMLFHRISIVARSLPVRTVTCARLIHIDLDSNETIVPLSKFDLSKPLIGRTNGWLNHFARRNETLIFSFRS